MPPKLGRFFFRRCFRSMRITAIYAPRVLKAAREGVLLIKTQSVVSENIYNNMSIIITSGHTQTAEVEFINGHPDVLSSRIAAEIVNALASKCSASELEFLRVDINVQSLAQPFKSGEPTGIVINVGGQITSPIKVDIAELAHSTVIKVLEQSGYFAENHFSPKSLTVNTDGITTQSANLNPTSRTNKFADSCVVYGHYVTEPYGLQGTFPSLILGKRIDETLFKLQKQVLEELHADGKLHITISYTNEGYAIEEIIVTTSHAEEMNDNLREKVKFELVKHLPELKQVADIVSVNPGGNFNIYYLQADSGVSKTKDNVIVTGGIHQLGTDAIWGKCLFKASSTAIPYAFALSRVVAEVTGASYASVRVFARYGQQDVLIQLEEIDSKVEKLRNKINNALNKLPKDRDAIRKIVGIEVTHQTYRNWNDIEGFHDDNKPWKQHNKDLCKLLENALR